jgi:hypothetical protein
LSTATLVARESLNILPQSAQSQFFELVADLGRLYGAYAWLAPVALPCQFSLYLMSNTYLKSDRFQEVDRCGTRKDQQDIINSDIRAEE